MCLVWVEYGEDKYTELIVGDDGTATKSIQDGLLGVGERRKNMERMDSRGLGNRAKTCTGWTPRA